jgi:RES domain-containing protein
MKLYRLSREMYANSLSGAGSAFKGARWNSVGVEIIYTAESRALAMAEVMVHLTAATVPDDYMMIVLSTPDTMAMEEVSVSDLPSGWNVFPYLTVIQKIGDSFVRENRFLLLRVPSAVVPGDFNILINPHHADFRRITIDGIEKFPFDTRIFHS